MKTNITRFVAIFLLQICSPGFSNAQALFKDLTAGNNSSNPSQLTVVNGTMYFITNENPTYNHQIWKTDGTLANTVLVKDSVITTNIGGIITFIPVNNHLFYALHKNGSATTATITELWKIDGASGTTTLIATLTNANPLGGTGDATPRNYTVSDGKIFFQMGSGNGMELWVSDGTAAGTKEVIDLNPGSASGFKYGGVKDAPMVAFNGKVYFSGGTTIAANELYSSDGTAIGTNLVKAGNTKPENFIVYKNELYFGALDGSELWKTNGTAPGTAKVVSTPFGLATLFKNELYYSNSGKLYKSDGTVGGTSLVMDSAGTIRGATANALFTSYMKSLPAPPYYTIYYWKSDGTPAGTSRISDSIGLASSFVVVDNKMYSEVSGSTTVGSGLWESDGTSAGSKNILAGGYIGKPCALNTHIFFSNFSTGFGYELWKYSTTSVGIKESAKPQVDFQLYPNPSGGRIQIEWKGSRYASLRVTNMMGEELLHQGISDDLDLSLIPRGIYFILILDEGKTYTRKVVLN